MPKTKISEFSATPANNTDIDSINIAEGCAPSGINDAIRELMSQLKDFQTGAVGDSFNGPVGTTTAAAGAFTTLSATGNVTLGDASTDTLNVGNGGLIKDASGNVGIGVTPSVWSVGKAVEAGFAGNAFWGNSSDECIVSQAAYYNSGWKYARSGAATHYSQLNGAHRWFNVAAGTIGNAITWTQAMTLDSSGNLLLGTTSQIASGYFCMSYANNARNGIVSNDTDTGGGTNIPILIRRNGSNIGSISTTTTTTAFNTSSDYRLKNTIVPMTGALAKVAELKPVTYKWNADGSDGEGFIAHELAEVVPQCVTGEKDAVDENGNPKYQGIDTSFLVATLTAAIQEQQSIIESLKARLDAANL